MKSFKFEVFSSNKVIFRNNINMLTIPTTEGQISIMAGHEPLIASALPGKIKVQIGGKIFTFETGGGLLETNYSGVTLYTARFSSKKKLVKKKLIKKHLSPKVYDFSSLTHAFYDAILDLNIVNVDQLRTDVSRSFDREVERPFIKWAASELLDSLLLNLFEGEKIIDFDANCNFFYKKICSSANCVLSIVFSDKKYEFLRNQFSLNNLEVYKEDEIHLRIYGKKFTVVLANLSLHKVKDLAVWVKSCRKNLVKKGKVCLSLVHPLFSLFLASQKNPAKQENFLKEYLKQFSGLKVSIKEAENYSVYHRCMMGVVRPFVKNRFLLDNFYEITLSAKFMRENKNFSKFADKPMLLLLSFVKK